MPILGEDQPLTLSEILDETHQLDADSKTKYWLEHEALRSNPKISASMMRQGGETTYMYKPPFQIMNKKALLKLLKQYSIKGMYFILGFVLSAIFWYGHDFSEKWKNSIFLKMGQDDFIKSHWC